VYLNNLPSGDYTLTATVSDPFSTSAPFSTTFTFYAPTIPIDATNTTELGTPANTQNCKASCGGDPVNVATGAFWHETTDFSLQAPTSDTALAFHRNYTAFQVAPTGDLGPNWRHNWETMLTTATSSPAPDLIWIDENGGPWYFTLQSNGSYLPPAGSQLTLTAFSDHFELQKSNHTVLKFSNGGSTPFGKLTSLVDRHGVTVLLAYDSSG
jgi:hypothetical protein